jgi:hypothetical protein
MDFLKRHLGRAAGGGSKADEEAIGVGSGEVGLSPGHQCVKDLTLQLACRLINFQWINECSAFIAKQLLLISLDLSHLTVSLFNQFVSVLPDRTWGSFLFKPTLFFS